MLSDTGLPTSATYAGYVRRTTELALRAVPDRVGLFIGVTSYHEDGLRHHNYTETTAASLRVIRLAHDADAPHRDFGVAVYVDFTATTADWTAYQHDWATTNT